MERAKLESLLIDYIDNKLNTVDRQRVEQEFVNNPQAYKLYEELKELIELMERSGPLEPSSTMKTRFEETLNAELAADKKSKVIFFQPTFYRAAAAIALLVVGGWIGFSINESNSNRLAEERRLAKIEEELRLTRQLMTEKLGNAESASQRIQGVNVAMTIASPDDEVVKALVRTMNEDNNSNVRLAALEALSKFIDDQQVRKELIASLAKQKDPIVQIQLIQLLVKIKEKTVVNDLQKIVDDEGTIQAVKDEAYSGILKLS
jgi:uncharacterized protein with von Willebrand factor type A (vWA) domain